MKKHVPNFITTLNILCGAIATVIAIESSYPLYYASIFIGLGAIFDFLDGMFARLLKAYSPMGKELDSLADMITFGLAPTVIILNLMKQSLGIETFHLEGLSFAATLLLIVPFIMVMFSGLRLAKFNVDTRQSESFIGLPTPANAILIASFPLILSFGDDSLLFSLIKNPFFLTAITIIESLLLVSEIPMFSLKFKNFDIKENKLRFIFLLLSTLLILFTGYASFTYIIILFIVLSLGNMITEKD